MVKYEGHFLFIFLFGEEKNHEYYSRPGKLAITELFILGGTDSIQTLGGKESLAFSRLRHV